MFRSRWMKWTLGTVIVIVAVFLLLQRFDAGRTLIVRSYVRADRLWQLYFPFGGGHGLLRRAEPMLVRAGIVRPVWVDIEPGVRMLLDPEDAVSRSTLVSRTNKWDPRVWDAISAGLSEGAVFLDVGAYTGYESLRAAVRVGPAGRVVAFEPDPVTLRTLRANIAASRAQNVTLVPIACTDRAQTLTLFDSSQTGNRGSSSLSEANAGAGSRPYTVEGRPIDDVVGELGLKRVDVMKADVEGAELLVVRGAAGTLARFHPRLILEVVPRQLAAMGASVEALEAFLASLGYNSMRAIDHKNREWTVR